MTSQQQHITTALARALLDALSGADAMRLRDIAIGARALSQDDLRAIPALRHLADGQDGPQMDLMPAIRALFVAHFDQPSDSAGGDLVQAHLEQNLFLAITKGSERAKEMAARLPRDIGPDNLRIGLFRTVQALKSGDLAKADSLFAILSEIHEIPDLESCGAEYEPELACVLFMKAIYADEELSAPATARLFEVLDSLPRDASLLRAILYNVALDIFLRQQRTAEAEQAAQRAVFHYAAAGERGVAFYVHLYLVVIALWRGDLAEAQKQLLEARGSLSEFEGAIENDALLLRSFELVVAYEQGDEDGFVAHLMSDHDTIPFGELWPSVAGPIISYGRRALANKVTPAAALSWVRRWRVRQRRSLRFDALISVQEALALQELGRWQEADEVLDSNGAHQGAELRIARCASGLDRTPKSAELARQIAVALDMADLSVRQRLILRLFATQSALARGMEREAARHLSTAIKEAGPGDLPAIWGEMRAKIAELLSKRGLREELRRFPQLRRQIQALAQADALEQPRALTRQEFRVLRLLAEAQSNKAIGARLGISLPTVKFHVANLCRKTGAANRQAAVQVAIERGWLGDC